MNETKPYRPYPQPSTISGIINEPTQPETKQPAAPAKPAVKPPAPKPEAKPSSTALSDFAAFLDKAPKEHLPTMMVRIANKCLAEKVFATPGAMAEAIVGASRK